MVRCGSVLGDLAQSMGPETTGSAVEPDSRRRWRRTRESTRCHSAASSQFSGPGSATSRADATGGGLGRADHMPSDGNDRMRFRSRADGYTFRRRRESTGVDGQAVGRTKGFCFCGTRRWAEGSDTTSVLSRPPAPVTGRPPQSASPGWARAPDASSASRGPLTSSARPIPPEIARPDKRGSHERDLEHRLRV